MNTVFSQRSRSFWPVLIAIPLLLGLLYNCIQIYNKYKKYDVVVSGKHVGSDNQEMIYHAGSKYSWPHFSSPKEEREESIILGILCICGVVFCSIYIGRFFLKKQITLTDNSLTYSSFILSKRIYIPINKITSVDEQYDPQTNEIINISLKVGRKIHSFRAAGFENAADFQAFFHAIKGEKNAL